MSQQVTRRDHSHKSRKGIILTVVKVKVTIASFVKADFYEGICRRHDARRVAVIKNGVRCAWPEGNPRGPAERGKAGVGSAIVVSRHNRCGERDEDEDVHRSKHVGPKRDLWQCQIFSASAADEMTFGVQPHAYSYRRATRTR